MSQSALIELEINRLASLISTGYEIFIDVPHERTASATLSEPAPFAKVRVLHLPFDQCPILSGENAKAYVVQFTGVDYEDTNFEMYLQELENLYEQQHRFLLVMDLSELKYPPSMTYFIRQTHFLLNHWGDIQCSVLGTCIFCPGVLQGLVAALFRAIPHQRPLFVFPVACESDTLHSSYADDEN